MDDSVTSWHSAHLPVRGMKNTFKIRALYQRLTQHVSDGWEYAQPTGHGITLALSNYWLIRAEYVFQPRKKKRPNMAKRLAPHPPRFAAVLYHLKLFWTVGTFLIFLSIHKSTAFPPLLCQFPLNLGSTVTVCNHTWYKQSSTLLQCVSAPECHRVHWKRKLNTHVHPHVMFTLLPIRY